MVGAERAAFDVAGRALAHRDLSTAALRAKLTAAGITEPLAEQTVARLVADGLVDDERTATARAAALAGRGYGDRAIDARLESEGFDRDLRTAALTSLEPEAVRAQTIVRGSGGRAPRRLAAALRRRGFGQDAIESALARVDVAGEPELR